MPYKLSDEIEAVQLCVGFDHFMMVDRKGQLWATGENTNGCLGTTDVKHRSVPHMHTFFDNKRIIDMACGDRFSVVICETYDMTEVQERKYNGGRALEAKNKQGQREFISMKQEIGSIRESISKQKGASSVPEDLRFKIEHMLEKNAVKHGRELTQLSHLSPSPRPRKKKKGAESSDEEYAQEDAEVRSLVKDATIKTTIARIQDQMEEAEQPEYMGHILLDRVKGGSGPAYPPVEEMNSDLESLMVEDPEKLPQQPARQLRSKSTLRDYGAGTVGGILKNSNQ